MPLTAGERDINTHMFYNFNNIYREFFIDASRADRCMNTWTLENVKVRRTCQSIVSCHRYKSLSAAECKIYKINYFSDWTTDRKVGEGSSS